MVKRGNCRRRFEVAVRQFLPGEYERGCVHRHTRPSGRRVWGVAAAPWRRFWGRRAWIVLVGLQGTQLVLGQESPSYTFGLVALLVQRPESVRVNGCCERLFYWYEVWYLFWDTCWLSSWDEQVTQLARHCHQKPSIIVFSVTPWVYASCFRLLWDLSFPGAWDFLVSCYGRALLFTLPYTRPLTFDLWPWTLTFYGPSFICWFCIHFIQ